MALYKKKLGIVVGTLALMMGAMSLFAHHSFTAEFDPAKPIKFSGKVTLMRWANPHAWIHVDVTDANGKVVNWALETGGANALIRRGWRKEDMAAGTVVMVEGWQARKGSPTANISSITFEDGRRLFAGTSNTTFREQ
jgi:hypothetical protein